MARIIVIDDDVQIRVLLKEILQQEGYEVVDAPDGVEGISTGKTLPTSSLRISSCPKKRVWRQ